MSSKPSLVDSVQGSKLVHFDFSYFRRIITRWFGQRITNAYATVPLGKGHLIRIIELHPSKCKDSPIICHLKVCSLTQSLDYEALSYAWEAHSGTERITCNRCEINVTKNCASALRRLRYTKKKRTLWIDAICINQESNHEKNHQVGIMGQIYSQASQVIIWLGESTTETDLGFEHLHRLDELISAKNSIGDERFKELVSEEVQNIKNRNPANPRVTEPGIIAIEPDDNNIYKPLFIIHEIFRRSWFTRIWTLQEVAFAKNGLVVCGDSRIEWSRLTRIFTTVDHPQMIYFMVATGCHELSRYFVKDPINQTLVNENPFDVVMQRSRGFLATDPKDKIFALNSIFERIGVHLPPADYSMSVDVVYTEAVKAIIQQGGSLAVLKQLTGNNKIQGLPSWVPDWSDSTFRTLPMEFEQEFEGHPLFFQVSDDGLRLTLKGKAIDCISTLGESLEAVKSNLFEDANPYSQPPNDEHGLREALLDRLKLIETFQKWVGIALHRLTGTPPNIAKTILVEVLTQNFALPGLMDQFGDIESIRNAFGWWLGINLADQFTLDTSLLAAAGLRYDPGGSFSPFETLFPDLTQREEWKRFKLFHIGPDPMRFGSHLSTSYGGYSLFATENSTLGIAPSAIQAGDLIFQFSGLNVPMIVHKDGDSYHLVAPAYVSGLMKGEAWSNIYSHIQFQEYEII